MKAPLISLLILGQLATAAPTLAAVQNGSTIPQALGLWMTNRGQQYFAEELNDFVFRSGYSLTDGGFEGWDYEAEEPIRLNDLPVRFQGFHSTFGAVRDIMKKWLRGFEFNDPRIAAGVKNIAYEASFNTLGIRVDRPATRLLPAGRGLVANFEAEIPALRVSVEEIRARDLSNPFLGTFGVNNLWAGISENSEPLRFRLPITVEINARDEIDMRVGELWSNLGNVTMDMGFDRPMMLPRVEVIINGRVMPVNQRRLEDKLLEHKQKLLQALQAYLEEHAVAKVHVALNNLMAEKMKAPFSDVNEMDPPGHPLKPVPAADKFRWGITPEQFRVSRDFLHFGLSMFIEDPRAANGGGVVSVRRTYAQPLLNLFNPDRYDAALTLNQDLINRLLGLSFQRGYFDRIEAGSSVLRLIRAPELRIDRDTARDRATFHIRAAQEVSGIESWIVRSPLEFEIDIVTKLVKTADGKVSVTLSGVDESSLRIEDRFIKSSLFRGNVFRAVRDKLRAANQDLARREKVLIDALPIPSNVGGLPIRVKDFQSDGNGYLVLYLEYNFARRRKP